MSNVLVSYLTMKQKLSPQSLIPNPYTVYGANDHFDCIKQKKNEKRRGKKARI